MNYYVAALKNYAVFSGRATRAEYWYFVLFNVIISIILGIFSGLIGDDNSIVGSIYGLAVFIPSLAAAVRRLHDIGKSGWWVLIALVPIIGWIWIIILLALDTVPADNKYGPNSKGSMPSPTPAQ